MEYSEVVRSVSYSQHEILYNIMQLHNDGEPFDADITYSTGGFYGEHKTGDGNNILIPSPQYKFDVCPQDDTITKIEPLGNIPLEDSSINSIVFDPPFIISVGPSLKSDDKDNNKIAKRFASYYPVSELLKSYYHWIEESYRVLQDNGLLVMKTQPTVTGGKELNSQFYSWLVAESLGFDLIDEFILIAKNRLHSGKIKTQQHARKFHSYFLVFKKSIAKKVKYLDWMTKEERTKAIDNLIKFNIKEK